MKRYNLSAVMLSIMLSIPSLAAAGQGKDQAARRVDDMTQKSQQALSNDTGKTATEANEGLNKAMDNSTTGRDNALSALTTDNTSQAAKGKQDDKKDQNGKQKAKQQVTEKAQKRQDALSQAWDKTPDEANQGLNKAFDRYMTGPDRANSALDQNWPSSPENAFSGHSGEFNAGGGVDNGGRPGFSGGSSAGSHGRGH